MKKSTVITVIVAIVFVSLCVCFTVYNIKSCNDRRPGENSSGDSSETECLHENGSWEVIAEPLCEADGERKYSCPDCGKTIIETIPALGHDYKNDVCTRCGVGKYDDCKHTSVTDWIVEKPSTCTEEGTKYKQCTVCGVKTDTASIPKAEHTASDWVVDKEATCTENGSRYNYCTVCSEKLKTETINSLGHDYKNDVCTRCGVGKYDDCKHTSVTDWIIDVNATCTEAGSMHKQCTVCKTVTETARIPAIGHEYSDWIIDRAATCTEAGTKHKECAGCGNKTTQSIAKLDHVPSDWIVDKAATCTESGSKHKQCTACGTKTETAKIPALGHEYSDWIIDRAATCTEAGTKHKECAECGNKTTQSISKLDHVPSDWIIEKEATCTESGSRYNYCTVCSEKLKTESISAFGHNYVSGVCARCGAMEVVYGDMYTREGNYIYFGSYPQTKVTDSATLNTLSDYTGTLPTSSNNQSWTNCKYYINDRNTTAFMWYKDVSYNENKYRAVYFTDYRPGCCYNESSTSDTWQDNNGYNTGTVYWFMYEPIKWRILTEANGSAFLMSEIAIDSQEYYHDASGTRTINGKTVYPNNYAESGIRSWLNVNFYDAAFDSLQQSIIKTTLVDNSAESTNSYDNPTELNNGVNDYVCENTEDKIFLLSQKEITNSAYGFGRYDIKDTKRQLKSSDYAKSQGCWQSSSYLGNCWWWLRSPHYKDSFRAYFGNFHGVVSRYDVHNTDYGVVPALWINL